MTSKHTPAADRLAAFLEHNFEFRERRETLRRVLADPRFQREWRAALPVYPKFPAFATTLIRVAALGCLCRYQSEQSMRLGELAREMEVAGRPATEIHAWFKQEMRPLHYLSNWVEDAAVEEFEASFRSRAKQGIDHGI